MAAVADVRQAETRDPQDAVDVRVQDRLLDVRGRLGERDATEREPGVVEEDVDSAERLDRRVDEGAARCLVGDVERERDVRVDALDATGAAATRTPASRSWRTVAAPIPDEAPVTTAVLPLRSMA